MNFVVPNGYVGYSNMTKRVYTEGQWINPFTVMLIDIRCPELVDKDQTVSCYKTRENAENTVEYRVKYTYKEDIKIGFCRSGINADILNNWIKTQIRYNKDMYLSEVSFGEVAQTQENIRNTENHISEELKKYLESKISESITENFPFLDIDSTITNISVKRPASWS